MPETTPRDILCTPLPIRVTPDGDQRRRAVDSSPEDRTMTRAHANQLERNLLAERARLEREIDRLSPPTDAAGGHGRLADDEIASAAGTSAEVDQVLTAHATRELDEVDRALTQLLEDPEHFAQ